ncbi:MAG: PDZ domain-containing protein [Paramuribaculum sp.]|nr:PDZ domain-containing protein [Paramuribaculum sp.]
MKPILSLLLIAIAGLLQATAKEVPQNAIPFILDSHVYIQATVCDTVPMSLIYDTGADRLYLDKDYMELSDFGKLPLKKGKARMGGAGNNGVQTVPIIIDPIPVRIGDVLYKDNITPIINLREILGRHTDGMIGNNAVFGKPLIINYTEGYLLPVDALTSEMLNGFTKLPAQFNDNRIDIELELKIDSVQTVKGNFRLDLGCGSTIILTNETLKKLNLQGKQTADCYYSNMGVGGDGTDVNFRADAFRFLDELNNIVISASYNTEGSLSTRPHVGIIGNEILRHYDLIIDAPNEVVYARRNNDTNTDYQHSSKAQFGYVDRTDISDGWIVSSLYDKGIAQAAGIEIEDIIISINGRPVKEISWEEQRNGLGLNGPTKYVVKKANGEIRTYVLNIDKEII